MHVQEVRTTLCTRRPFHCGNPPHPRQGFGERASRVACFGVGLNSGNIHAVRGARQPSATPVTRRVSPPPLRLYGEPRLPMVGPTGIR